MAFTEGKQQVIQNPLNLLTKNSTLLKIFLFSVLAKIVLAFFIPIAGDESYYWFWGQNLQLSYFDHPPAVAWLTLISNFFYNLFPPDLMSLSFRLPFIFLSSLTLFVWLKNYSLENEDRGDLVLFSILYLLNPLLGLGGIFATPDIPLMLFWSLAYFSVLKIRLTQKRLWYILLGVSLGLGFCSKYHIVLFPPAVLIALLWLKDYKLIQFRKLFLTFIFGLIFCAPVLIWNAQNDWASFNFQLNHGLNAPKPYDWKWTAGYFLAQSLIFNPVILFYLVKHVQKSFSKSMAFSQWAFFTYSSFKAVVEGNWTITAHVQALAAVDKKFKDYFKFSLIYASLFWLGLIAVLLTPFGTEKLRLFPQSHMATQIYNATKDYRPLYGPTYQISSLLHFISKEPVYKLKGLSRHDFYDRMPQSFPVENTFYVLKYTHSGWPAWIENYKLELITDKNLSYLNQHSLEVYRVSSYE